jgi:FkbM family methyltransferase
MLLEICAKVLRVLSVPAYRSALLRCRVFASTEHDNILNGLALETVVDIGANRGQFALCVRRLYPNAQIYSFEPLSAPAKKYLQLFKQDLKVQLFNLAIAPQSGPAAMHVSRWDVSSSLLPIAQAQHDNFPFTEESRSEMVATTPLTACIGKSEIAGTALLKLDVQGYELQALRGCAELLGLFKYVYVESSFIELYVGQALAADVIAYLLGQGFALVCVANLSYGNAGKPIQADFLFSKP